MATRKILVPPNTSQENLKQKHIKDKAPDFRVFPSASSTEITLRVLHNEESVASPGFRGVVLKFGGFDNELMYVNVLTLRVGKDNQTTPIAVHSACLFNLLPSAVLYRDSPHRRFISYSKDTDLGSEGAVVLVLEIPDGENTRGIPTNKFRYVIVKMVFSKNEINWSVQHTYITDAIVDSLDEFDGPMTDFVAV